MNAKNSKRRGDIGVGRAIAWASQKGFTTLISISDSQDYDLVIDMDGVLKRIQVKTTSCSKDGKTYNVNLRIMGGNRSGTGKSKKLNKQNVDAIFVMTEIGDIYLIPVFDNMPLSTLRLGPKYDIYRV